MIVCPSLDVRLASEAAARKEIDEERESLAARQAALLSRSRPREVRLIDLLVA
jgi:hypothetical protein